MTFWLADWLRAFAITLVVELAVAGAMLARAERRLHRRIGAIALVNLASHPLVWFVFPALGLAHPSRLALSETWAVVSELAGYRVIWPELSLRRAAMVSLCANATSFAAGLALQAWGVL
jgi:hypothetical protein